MHDRVLFEAAGREHGQTDGRTDADARKADTVNHHRDTPTDRDRALFKGESEARSVRRVVRLSVRLPSSAIFQENSVATLTATTTAATKGRSRSPPPSLRPPPFRRAVAFRVTRAAAGDRTDCCALRLFALHRGVPFSGSDVSGIL